MNATDRHLACRRAVPVYAGAPARPQIATMNQSAVEHLAVEHLAVDDRAVDHAAMQTESLELIMEAAMAATSRTEAGTRWGRTPKFGSNHHFQRWRSAT